MSTLDFDVALADAISSILSRKFPELELQIPSSGSYASGPQADLIVHDPATGHMLVVEVKSGPQGESIPLSTLPQLRALKHHYESRGDVVLITTGTVPQPVRQGLSMDQIDTFEVQSPLEAAMRLEAKLAGWERCASGSPGPR